MKAAVVSLVVAVTGLLSCQIYDIGTFNQLKNDIRSLRRNLAEHKADIKAIRSDMQSDTESKPAAGELMISEADFRDQFSKSAYLGGAEIALFRRQTVGHTVANWTATFDELGDTEVLVTLNPKTGTIPGCHCSLASGMKYDDFAGLRKGDALVITSGTLAKVNSDGCWFSDCKISKSKK